MPALALLVLKTRQLERLREFYQAIGCELVAERHGSEPPHYAGRLGELVFELYPLPDDDSSADATTRIGVNVVDLAGVLRKLGDQGVPIMSGPRVTEWGLRAVVRDPDRRAVELYER